jgi:fluoride ion exporter CrcB/FEX
MTGKRRALWIGVALLIACMLTIGTIWMARRAVGADTERLAEQAVEMALAQRPASSRGSDDQVRAQMMPLMRGMVSLYPVMIPAGIFLSTVVISSVLFGAYRVAGVPVRWPMTFAACSTGAAATALIRFCVMLLVVFVMKQSIPPESLVDNSIVPLHVAAFLPADTSAVWRSAASKLDLFLLVFVVGLIAYLVDEEGFARDARKIVWATVGCYALWILLGMLWAAAWSGFAR